MKFPPINKQNLQSELLLSCSTYAGVLSPLKHDLQSIKTVINDIDSNMTGVMYFFLIPI